METSRGWDQLPTDAKGISSIYSIQSSGLAVKWIANEAVVAPGKVAIWPTPSKTIRVPDGVEIRDAPMFTYELAQSARLKPYTQPRGWRRVMLVVDFRNCVARAVAITTEEQTPLRWDDTQWQILLDEQEVK